MPEITCQIINSVREIKKEDWEQLFGEIPEGYGFYQSLEQAKLEEFSFYYLLLYQQGQIVLIAPLFIADFDLAIATAGLSRRWILAIRRLIPRFLIFRTLFCGTPFGEHADLGAKKDSFKQRILALKLANATEEFSRQQKASLVIFKDFPRELEAFLDNLIPEGFFKTGSFPSVVTKASFNNFEDYLASLSHATRKNLRRKLKKAKAAGQIEVKSCDRVDDIIDEIFRLYEFTYSSGSTKFERLTKEFFIAVAKNMPGEVKFFLYYCDGKLGAFNLCFIYPDLFIDKFIGFDYDVSNKFNLYFVSWVNNIQWCIKNSISYLSSGQTDYEPKERLGGELVGLNMYLKHANKAVYSILKIISGLLKPKT
ncbi:MAG: GNAT family N-acetyltransferase [Candidatus Omnitrophota bacterium]